MVVDGSGDAGEVGESGDVRVVGNNRSRLRWRECRLSKRRRARLMARNWNTSGLSSDDVSLISIIIWPVLDDNEPLSAWLYAPNIRQIENRRHANTTTTTHRVYTEFGGGGN